MVEWDSTTRLSSQHDSGQQLSRSNQQTSRY